MSFWIGGGYQRPYAHLFTWWSGSKISKCSYSHYKRLCGYSGFSCGSIIHRHLPDRAHICLEPRPTGCGSKPDRSLGLHPRELSQNGPDPRVSMYFVVTHRKFLEIKSKIWSEILELNLKFEAKSLTQIVRKCTWKAYILKPFGTYFLLNS